MLWKVSGGAKAQFWWVITLPIPYLRLSLTSNLLCIIIEMFFTKEMVQERHFQNTTIFEDFFFITLIMLFFVGEMMHDSNSKSTNCVKNVYHLVFCKFDSSHFDIIIFFINNHLEYVNTKKIKLLPSWATLKMRLQKIHALHFFLVKNYLLCRSVDKQNIFKKQNFLGQCTTKFFESTKIFILLKKIF